MSLQPVDGSPVVADGISQLRHAIVSADTHRAQLAEAGDWESLAHGLAALNPLLADLRELARAIEDDVAELMPSKQEEVAGLGVIERRRGTNRRAWDWDDLLPRLVRAAVDPDGTGELPDPTETIERMVGLIRDGIGVTPSKGPRIRYVRDQGLDPDEYAETSPGRSTIQIHGGAE